MEKIFVFSYLTIALLALIIIGGMSIIRSNLKEGYKIIPLAGLHFIIYCLLQYSYEFIQWTIRFNKFDNYPYKNPFCVLVIIYCIISFIIFGIYYIKYNKYKYSITSSILFLLVIHLLAILFVLFFSPFKNWF